MHVGKLLQSADLKYGRKESILHGDECSKTHGRARCKQKLKINAIRGQAIVEYSFVLALVVGVIMGMQLYSQRGIQGKLKMAADQLSPFANDTNGELAQNAGMQYETGDRTSDIFAPGRILKQESNVRSEASQLTSRISKKDGEFTTDTPKFHKGKEVNVNRTFGNLAGNRSSVTEVVVAIVE